MIIVIKGIHKVKRKQANGTIKTHYYAWRGGPKMVSEPGSEAFAAEHLRFKEQLQPTKTPDTLESLIEYFTGTEDKPNEDFLRLAQSTRDDHLYAFKLIRKEWPNLPVRLTQQKGMKADIRKWHRSFAKNPRKADKLLFSLSKVFSYAINDELIDKNPCKGIGRLYKGSRKNMLWKKDQIDTFRAGAKPHILLPWEIAYQTGQRQGDILSLTWNQYDGEYLQFRQSKGGKQLKVKVRQSLKLILDSTPKRGMRICLTTRDTSWTKDGFQASWKKQLQELKITGLTFHDLRGTFITERFAEGNSVEDIAKISGHSVQDIKAVLEKHYLAPDQDASDAVIIRMDQKTKNV